MDTRQATERLTWSTDFYPKSTLPTQAMCEGTCIAEVCDCPAGWAVRICCIPFGQRGAHEIFPTYETAVRAVESWVCGLDIDPGDNLTRE